MGHVNAYLELLRDRPFFIYIHTNDTHEHFAASEPFGSMWGSSYENRYEGEITYVDHYFKEVLQRLDDLGIAQRTLVVATSDHGTEFREHGFLEKKLNLYEEILQVPVIMKLPDLLPAGTRVPGQAQTVDIPATILEVCGIRVPENADGQGMLSRIGGEVGGPHMVFSHTLHETAYWYEHWAARTSRYKLIRTQLLRKPKRRKNLIPDRFERLQSAAERRGSGLVELYDLKHDPAEQINVAGENEDLVQEFEDRLKSWVGASSYEPPGGWP